MSADGVRTGYAMYPRMFLKELHHREKGGRAYHIDGDDGGQGKQKG